MTLGAPGNASVFTMKANGTFQTRIIDRSAMPAWTHNVAR